MNSTLDWQGHRGCRGIMPENTILGFLKAIDFRVSTIEMDVIVSGDGQVVVSHESYFRRDISLPPPEKNIELTEDNEKLFNLYKMTYSEISKWDVGSKGNVNFQNQKKLPAYKPLLKDVIEAVESYAKKNYNRELCYSIEMKYFSEMENKLHPPAKEFARKVAEVISQSKIESRSVVQAFNTGILNDLKGINPNLKCSFLFHDSIELLDNRFKKLNFKPEVFGPHHALVNPSMLDKFHDLGIKVIPWTVNNIDRIKELILMGIDGIITDYPNYLNDIRPILEERGISIQGIG